MFKKESQILLGLTLLYSIVLSVHVQMLIGITDVQVWSPLLFLAGFIALLYLLSRFPKTLAVIVAIVVLFGLLNWYYNWLVIDINDFGFIYQPIRWMVTINDLKGVRPEPFYPAFALVISLVSFIVFYWLRDALIALLILIFPLFFISAEQLNNQWLFLFVFGLFSVAGIVGYHKVSQRTPSWPSIILVVVLALTASTLIPSTSFFNDGFSDWINEFGDGPRRTASSDFSLNQVGFNAGNTRIGGPAELTNEPYMRVTGPSHAFYLRGTIFNEFDDNVWFRSSMEGALPFRNVEVTYDQNNVYRYGLKERSGLSAYEIYPLSIVPLNRTFHTVFTSSSPQMIGMGNDVDFDFGDWPNLAVLNDNNFRYNLDGQMTSSRLIRNDGYKLIDNAVPTRNQSLSEVLNAGYDVLQSVEKYEYENMVRVNDPELHRIIYEELPVAENKLLWIQAAINHFHNNYFYSLNVANVPIEDSVIEWFLENKVGYCVYFGSTLTILLQDVGVDARYVEGFVVPATSDENGERTVTTNTAHAWTEVNLSTIGWFPVDATSAQHLIALDSGNVTGHLDDDDDVDVDVPPVPDEEPDVNEPGEQPDVEQPEPTESVAPYLVLMATLALLGYLIKKWSDLVKERHSEGYLLRHFKDRERDLIVYLWRDLLKIAHDRVDKSDSIKETLVRLNLHQEEITPIIERVVYSTQLASQIEARKVFSFIEASSEKIFEQKSFLTKYFYRWFVTCCWIRR